MDFNVAARAYRENPTKENLESLTKELCDEMTNAEKIKMLQGHAMKATVRGIFSSGRVYNATPYGAGGCKRLGIPEVRFTDGPRGIVIGKSTCFPVSMLRGATFDDELEYRVGVAFAKEAIAGGANYFAGICINLLRHPKWGRAQETYGEDACLLGKMGVALTKAVQDYGMIACPKHYALNSIEDLRFSVSANVDERTLHEVYLPHFKKCIDAGALSVMGAYNRVNGEYCCENKTLLTDILRNRWGFDGFTISDFFYGIYSPSKALDAGLDVEMPYTFKYAALGALLKAGKIAQETIDTAVQRVVSVLLRTVPDIKPQEKSVILCNEHISLAREVAQKGTVLLKNNGVLPLCGNEKIAVVGRYADKINVGDHGSSNVFSPYAVTPYQGIARRFGKENVRVYNGCDPQKAVETAYGTQCVIVCVGSDHKQEGEFLVNFGSVKKKPQNMGGDRVSLRIPPEDVRLIRAIAATGRKVVVNIMGGSAYVINDWKDSVGAILMSFYSGIEGGNALADIISGDVNPSGKLPFTVAAKESDYPSFLHIDDEGRDITYDYYHGYTLFEKYGTKPDYPFGFGLSYTDFEVTGNSAEVADGKITVTAEAKNVGKRAGDTVVQVYVGSDSPYDDRPVKLLKGFRRVSLAAGESKTVTVEIDTDDIKFYDEMLKEFRLDPVYKVYAGDSSQSAKPFAKLDFFENI